jgi:hypothetical protein
MKTIILACLTLAAISCQKTPPVPFDPNRAYIIEYDVQDQVVKTRVVNDTLRLDFYQDINFLVDPDEYANSWALHLIQDFSNSYLKDLHFDMIASAAGYAHDWVPINLNDVHPNQKKVSSAVVNGKEYVKISLKRVFEFYSVLSSNQAALQQENTLLQTSTHKVLYKAFYSFNSQYSLSNDGQFNIVYSR